MSRVPPACCPPLGDDLWPDPCLEDNRHKHGVCIPGPSIAVPGCYGKLRSELIAQHGVAIGIATAVAFIELFGIMMAFCLCNAISNELRGQDDDF